MVPSPPPRGRPGGPLRRPGGGRGRSRRRGHAARRRARGRSARLPSRTQDELDAGPVPAQARAREEATPRVTATVATYAELAARILALPSSGARLVAVDGRGGAGKSVFAERLALALGGAPVVPTDDFATGEPGVEWWPRLEREVAMPLAHGQPARYRRYDWPSRTLAEWCEIPVAPAVVIEGVSSARRAAAPLLAFSV